MIQCVSEQVRHGGHRCVHGVGCRPGEEVAAEAVIPGGGHMDWAQAAMEGMVRGSSF